MNDSRGERERDDGMDEREKNGLSGAFINSLKRNNREIRDDRATAIAEDTQLVYKRRIEDLEISIKKMQREQEYMLDLSPTSTQSLILASDFNCEEYVAKDIDVGIKIRNTEITLEIARQRYEYLFGGK
ncbi:MAG: hypothetical protein WBM35_14720 [Candidatus Electrothrix sp.]